MTTTSYYTTAINAILCKIGAIGYDPRHVEAYMRLEHSTLDGLSAGQFAREVRISLECIDYAGKKSAESLAVSFGL